MHLRKAAASFIDPKTEEKLTLVVRYKGQVYHMQYMCCAI